MTGISAASDEDQPGHAAVPPVPADQNPGGAGRLLGTPGVRRWIWALEHAQDAVAVTVGIVLIVLAAVLLVSSVVDFVDGTDGSISAAAPTLLDHVLLVLILVEIVYTVVLSLRAHRLVAQPFIVVGLIAVIRRILVVLTPPAGTSHTSVSASELALLIGMVAVFVAGLIAVSIFEKGEESGPGRAKGLASGLVSSQGKDDRDGQ